MRGGGVGGYSLGQGILHESATAMHSKTLIIYIPDVQNSMAIVS